MIPSIQEKNKFKMAQVIFRYFSNIMESTTLLLKTSFSHPSYFPPILKEIFHTLFQNAWNILLWVHSLLIFPILNHKTLNHSPSSNVQSSVWQGEQIMWVGGGEQVWNTCITTACICSPSDSFCSKTNSFSYLNFLAFTLFSLDNKRSSSIERKTVFNLIILKTN